MPRNPKTVTVAIKNIPEPIWRRFRQYCQSQHRSAQAQLKFMIENRASITEEENSK